MSPDWKFLRRGLLAALSGTVLTGAAAAADLELGEWLAQECSACHGPGASAQGIAPITGWPEEVFVAIMLSYRDRERENVTMQTIAARLTDEDIAALAAWYATLGAE